MRRNIKVQPAPQNNTEKTLTSDDILDAIAHYQVALQVSADDLKKKLAAVIKANNEHTLGTALTDLHITLSDSANHFYNLQPADVKHFKAEFLKAYITAFYPDSPVVSGRILGSFNTAESWFKDTPFLVGGYQHNNIAGFLILNGLAQEDGGTDPYLPTRAEVEAAALRNQGNATTNAMGTDLYNEIMRNKSFFQQQQAAQLAAQQQQAAQQQADQAVKDAIAQFVSWLEDGSITKDKGTAFVQCQFAGKTADEITAKIKCLDNAPLSLANFDSHRDVINTPILAQQLQRALVAKQTEMQSNTDAAIQEIVKLCHQYQLDIDALVNFAKDADLSAANNVDSLISALLPTFDAVKRALFLGAAHQKAREDLQAALRDALPEFLAPDADITRPAAMNAIQVQLISTVLGWYSTDKTDSKGLQAFLNLNPTVIAQKSNSELVALLNRIKSGGFLSPVAVQDGGLGLDDLRAAVVQLQKELKEKVAEKERRDNGLKQGGQEFNELERDFITAELLHRMSEGQLNEDKLKQFMDLSWNAPNLPQQKTIIDEAISSLNDMGEDVEGGDEFFKKSFGNTDSYFNRLKNASSDFALILKALQQLQASLKAQQQNPRKTKSDVLTSQDLAKYLVKNITANLTDLLTPGDPRKNSPVLKKQVEQFRVDKSESEWDEELINLVEILQKDTLPQPNSEDDKALRSFFEFAEGIRASLANSSALKQVFDRFKSIFDEQKIESEKPKKAGEADTAIFESVQFCDPSKEKVIVVTKGDGDVKDRTATITRHKDPNNESIDVVGSMQAVVNAIVALYKAEDKNSQKKEKFSLDIDSLNLTDSAGNELAAPKKQKIANLLDEKFKKEFPKQYEAGSAQRSLTSSVRTHFWRRPNSKLHTQDAAPDDAPPVVGHRGPRS